MNAYAPLLVMIIAALVLAVVGLVLSAILSPNRYNRVKLEVLAASRSSTT